MASTYRGSCLCGEVIFEAGNFSKEAAACHCTMCRKFHGAAFGTLVTVSHFNWLSGVQLLGNYKADNGTVRTFCKKCGSSLGFRSEGGEFEVAIACFDEDIPVKIDAHIYTANKACWVEPDDSVPNHVAGRP